MGKNKNSIDYDDDFIRENFNQYSLVELAKLLSKRQGVTITAKNLSRHINKLGLSKRQGTKVTNLKGEELDKFLKDNGYYELPGHENYVVHKDTLKFYSKREMVEKKIIKNKKDGYAIIKVIPPGSSNKDYAENLYIHVTLAKLFIPNPDPVNNIEVNHINGDKMDYSLDNLEWVTSQNNIIHARKTGLNKSNVHDNKTTDSETVATIYLDYKKDNTQSYNSIAKKYNVSPNTVKRIVCKERFKNITDDLD